MKRWIPWITVLIALAWLGSSMCGQGSVADGMDANAFGKLPVLAGGRIKPFDTLARNSLLIISGKQVLRRDGKRIGADRWLLDVLFDSEAANQHRVFQIHNPEVLGLFGWQQDKRKRFSFAELTRFLTQIDEQGRQAGGVEAADRSPYQTAILNLYHSMILYQRLGESLRPRGSDRFAEELDRYAALAPAGMEAMAQRQAGQEFDKDALAKFTRLSNRYGAMGKVASVRPVPPEERGATEWRSVGTTLAAPGPDGTIDPVVRGYAAVGDAFRAGDDAAFNREVEALAGVLGELEPEALGRTSFEFVFNWIQPFYRSMVLYVLAFLLASASWLGWGPQLRRAAVLALVIGLVIHTFGLGARMYLQGRPPVTNLYSSAIFIGWGTVVIGLFLERYFKDGIGTACAGAIGFASLVIAHHLAGSGDTLEMLQAVLDTNLWLATHVVTITAGYSAMFLAGMLAILHVVRGVLTRSLTPELDKSLARMVYGVICFATFFSFVGTVLGGIWADQSWGRFWGWDPKENGALLIVLWCAIILHARWGGFLGRRGLMIMAIFGNVITSFSWFGVNMLNVGLHSYGFMSKAFPWLVAFIISQLLLMALAAIPLNKWRSFRAA